MGISLSFLDILILVVFLFSVLWGFYRGFVRELFALLSWFCALEALKYTDPLTLWWHDQQLPQPDFFSPLVLFLGAFFLFQIIGVLFSHLAQKANFLVLDSAGGGALGFVRGFLVSCLALWFLQQTTFAQKNAFKHSVFRPTIEKEFSRIRPFFPKQVNKWIAGYK